ncbi:hypothetical protein ACP70R_036897 [Stipagrostis hirtigluma subsp. patula]
MEEKADQAEQHIECAIIYRTPTSRISEPKNPMQQIPADEEQPLTPFYSVRRPSEPIPEFASAGEKLTPGSNRVLAPRRFVCPSVVQAAIVKGEHQYVHFPLTKIFEEVMQVMKAPPAIYDHVLNDENLYEASVEFTVPRPYANSTEDVKMTIISTAFESSVSAEQDVLKRAFAYLLDEHQIVIMDHSSNVVRKYESKCHKIYSIANNIKCDIEKVMANWDRALGNIDESTAQLSMKSFGQSCGAMKIYGDAIRNLNSIVKKGKEWHQDVLKHVETLEKERLSYLKENNARCTAEWIQAPRKRVSIPSKATLAYLTNYIGCSKKPLFQNHPVGKYSFRAEVMMALPRLEGIRCGGVTVIPGPTSDTSLEAEDKAAEEAVPFIERHYKVTVSDLNFQERVQAKNRKAEVKQLQKHAEIVGNAVFKNLSYMVEYVTVTRELYDQCCSSCSSNPTPDEAVAFQFCASKISEIGDAFQKIHDEASATIRNVAI